MAKLTVKHQKIFASASGATGIVGKFGSYKSGSPEYSIDPDITQGLPAWYEGWGSAVDVNRSPTIQDLNAYFYVLSYMIAYLNQGFLPAEYSSERLYYMEHIAADGTGNIFRWRQALEDSGYALDENKWSLIRGMKSVNISDNYTVAYDVSFVNFNSGPQSGHNTITLPQAEYCCGRIITVAANYESGSGVQEYLQITSSGSASNHFYVYRGTGMTFMSKRSTGDTNEIWVAIS